MTENETSAREVLVCQSRACRKLGAAKVIAAFLALPIPEVTVIPSGCLGQCGNGPMVLVMPEQVWYSRVHPDEVPAVVERHLIRGKPVVEMLYQAVSRQPSAISPLQKPF